ncbi:hypothetical protein ACSNOI_39600 [Actinomadura kijaniata]
MRARSGTVTAPTGDHRGVAVVRDRPNVLAEIDGALATVIADGRPERRGPRPPIRRG